MAEVEDESWRKKTIPKIVKILCTNPSSVRSLSQRDLCSLLLISPCCYRTLLSLPSLALDLREMNKAGERLISALSLERYRDVKSISFEFARDVEDDHLIQLKTKAFEPLRGLESLNLNGCLKISDIGVEAISSLCPQLRTFSIYWNVRITDLGVKHLVKNCKRIMDLNLSGCKNVTDQSLPLIADNYQELEVLNITRCIKLTDIGLQKILLKCIALQSLNLYALSRFARKAYESIGCLAHLRFLNLCGAQSLSDHGLSCIARCKNLVSLNLTWCVNVTDMGVIAIAQSCRSLEFLSLFGIVGVTDKSLEALSKFCSNTM